MPASAPASVEGRDHGPHFARAPLGQGRDGAAPPGQLGGLGEVGHRPDDPATCDRDHRQHGDDAREYLDQPHAYPRRRLQRERRLGVEPAPVVEADGDAQDLRLVREAVGAEIRFGVPLDEGDPGLARAGLDAPVEAAGELRLVGAHGALGHEAVARDGEAVARRAIRGDHPRDGVGRHRVEEAHERGDAVDDLRPRRRAIDPRRFMREHREGRDLRRDDGEHEQERQPPAERMRHQPHGKVLTSAART
jgi:hypothetical protein